MRSWLSVVGGLLAGVLSAVVILAGVVLLWPPAVPATPSASPVAVSTSPSASTAGSPTAAPGGSGSAGPSGSGSGSPGASGSLGASGSVDPSVAATLFHIGEPAPALVVPQVGGGTIDLANLKGKPVWVNFWQTTCPPCVDEFPLMNGFAVRFADDGLVVLAIDVREDQSMVAAFAQEVGATFPLGLDADGAAQRAWGAFALPVHYWIDREGIVRDGALGGIGPDIMARGVRTILPGVVVEP